MKYKDNFISFFIAVVLAAGAFYYAALNPAPSELRYAGSEQCSRCHEAVYKSWKNTLHAKALIDKKGFASLPELPAITARHALSGETSEIVYAMGFHWTRRYLLSNNRVSPFLYSLPSNNFSDYYDVNYKRSDYQIECIGCHTTGAYEKNNSQGGRGLIGYSEPGVACEACHGPGSAHIQLSDIRYIVNPKKINQERRDMICMSCHTNGYDKSGRYKFPLGYKPGDNLEDYFFNMSPKPGQIKYNHLNRFDYKADGSIADRFRQYAYWQYMFMAAEGFSCEDCLDFRKAPENKNLTLPREAGDKKNAEHKNAPDFFTINQYCMSCHASIAPFREYASAAELLSGPGSKCDFIKYRMSLESSAREESCIKCHKSDSVHQHYYIIENGSAGR